MRDYDPHPKAILVVNDLPHAGNRLGKTDTVSDMLEALANCPNPQCRKCYGRGTLGRSIETGFMLKCKCVKGYFDHFQTP